MKEMKAARYWDKLFMILITGIVFCQIFLNVGYDSEYQLAMAYRRFLGDIPIIQMWEPHQSSAFLCTFFMRIYLSLTKTSTGIVVFMQAVGMVIRLAIALSLYHLTVKISGKKPAFFVFLIYLLVSPKDLLIPEFSNMQLWFGTLTFLFLAGYFEKGKKYHLIFAAFSLCLEILTYPSCILNFLISVFLIGKYSKTRRKDILLFTGVCILFGIFVLCYYFSGKNMAVVRQCITSAIRLEPSHTSSFIDKIKLYGENLIKMAGVLLLVGAVGLLVDFFVLFCFRHKENNLFFSWRSGLELSFIPVLLYLLINILRGNNRADYAYALQFFMLFGFVCRKYLREEKEKRNYDMAVLIGSGNLCAALILSDHPVLPSVPYGVLIVCFSVLPLIRFFQSGELRRNRQMLGHIELYVFISLLVFRCIYLHVSMFGFSQTYTILDDMALIRSGPAAGLITDEEGAARQRDSMQEWGQYIKEGQKIWILGGGVVDTMGYLYKTIEVAAPTVMSTPTYNEALEYYWEINPEKFPDVVILASSFGTLDFHLLGNEWLMNWLEEKFKPTYVIDGNYWRYYFR